MYCYKLLLYNEDLLLKECVNPIFSLNRSIYRFDGVAFSDMICKLEEDILEQFCIAFEDWELIGYNYLQDCVILLNDLWVCQVIKVLHEARNPLIGALSIDVLAHDVFCQPIIEQLVFVVELVFGLWLLVLNIVELLLGFLNDAIYSLLELMPCSSIFNFSALMKVFLQVINDNLLTSWILIVSKQIIL